MITTLLVMDGMYHAERKKPMPRMRVFRATAISSAPTVCNVVVMTANTRLFASARRNDGSPSTSAYGFTPIRRGSLNRLKSVNE